MVVVMAVMMAVVMMVMVMAMMAMMMAAMMTTAIKPSTFALRAHRRLLCTTAPPPLWNHHKPLAQSPHPRYLTKVLCT